MRLRVRKPKHTDARGCISAKVAGAQFTITVNTIFEDSHIPLNKWLLAFHLMCSIQEGHQRVAASARTLGRRRGNQEGEGQLSDRVVHVPSHPLGNDAITNGTELLSGIVEVDETYIGGREPGKARYAECSRGKQEDSVLALVERGGNVRSFPLERVTSKTIKPILKQHIDPKSHLVTDESTLYISSAEHVPRSPHGQPQGERVRSPRARFHRHDEHGRIVLRAHEADLSMAFTTT